MDGQVLHCRWEDEMTLGFEWEDEDGQPRPPVTLLGRRGWRREDEDGRPQPA